MSKLFISVFVVAAIAISCNKELSATNNSSTTPVADSSKYMSFTPTSSWTYQNINHLENDSMNLTITSSSRDTSIGARKYHIFSSSDGEDILYNITGNDYYTISDLTATLGVDQIELLYLKDGAAVNTTWQQSYSINSSGIPVVISISNTLVEKDINKTVNGTVYKEVIHVSSKISGTVAGMPVPDNSLKNNIDLYYAKKYGLILGFRKVEINLGGVNEGTDLEIRLLEASIK